MPGLSSIQPVACVRYDSPFFYFQSFCPLPVIMNPPKGMTPSSVSGYGCVFSPSWYHHHRNDYEDPRDISRHRQQLGPPFSTRYQSQVPTMSLYCLVGWIIHNPKFDSRVIFQVGGLLKYVKIHRGKEHERSQFPYNETSRLYRFHI